MGYPENCIRMVAKEVGIAAEVNGITKLNGGHIHESYRVDCGLHYYLFQRIGDALIPTIQKSMANLACVNAAGVELPLQYRKDKQGNMIIRVDATYWRVCDYIPSRNYESCPDVTMAEVYGRVYGHFLKLLAAVPTEGMETNLPGRHKPLEYFEQLVRDYEEWERARGIKGAPAGVDPIVRSEEYAATDSADSVGRSEVKVKDLFRRITSMKGLLQSLEELRASGAIPTRVTHNDTKCSNVLHTDRGAFAIDYDTIMPGLLAYDYGDCVRSTAVEYRRIEDAGEPLERVSGADIEKEQREKFPRLDAEKVTALTEVFVEELEGVITEAEKSSLALGPAVVALELAIRYLDDYITGSKYFRPADPETNLRKATFNVELAENCRRDCGAPIERRE